MEDILPRRYETLAADLNWVHQVRCSLLGLEAGSMPSKEDINTSERFVPQVAAWEQPKVITDHWLPILREEGLLAECTPDQFATEPDWVPLYTKDSLVKHLPMALSTFPKAGPPSLTAMVPPGFSCEYRPGVPADELPPAWVPREAVVYHWREAQANGLLSLLWSH